MKICPKCLRQYESGNFCENCENEDGSPVKLEEEQVSCPKCGLKYKKGTKFCSECGTRLDGTGTSNAAGTAGLSMGDKNVIAGDVIGHKEETHIAGNATIIKNEDQTKQVKKCHICGSIVQIVDGFDCPECHQFTCASCFDSDAGCCNDCVEQLKKRNEEEFKSALKMAYADGRIEYSERQQLNTLQHKLKISDEKAKLFEQQFRGDTAEALTTTEKLSIEQATKLYYKEENYTEALNLIKPIFENHQTREEVLNLYLPLLAETDSEQALNFINSMQVDVLMAYITAIDILLKQDILDEAERKYNRAARIWPDNALVKCYQVLLNYALYKKFGQQNFIDKAKELVENLGEAQNQLELSMQVRVQMFMQEVAGETIPEITKEFCEDNQLYWYIIKYNPFSYTPKKKINQSLNQNTDTLTVGFDDDCDFQSIQKAIDSLADGGTIYIRPGVYEEDLTINKDVSLMGLRFGDISDYASIDLPIIVLNPKKPCVIERENVYLEGLVFTHDKNLSFDSMDDLISEDEYNCINKKWNINSEDFKTLLWIQSDIQLHNSAILHSVTNGITFSKGNALVDDLLVYCAGDYGIWCAENASPHFTTVISMNNSEGIYVTDNAEPIINNSCCLNNQNNGLLLVGKSNAVTNESKYNNNGSSGVDIRDNATPLINDCNIYENSQSNLYISNNSKPEINNCRIEDGNDIGIKILNNSRPKISDCEIFNNANCGVRVDNRANPDIIDCSIHNNSSNGLHIASDATGKYTRCEIYSNKRTGKSYPGVVISDRANPILDSCEVYDHLASGIWIKDNAKGTYKDCEIHDNKGGISKDTSKSVNTSSCEEWDN